MIKHFFYLLLFYPFFLVGQERTASGNMIISDPKLYQEAVSINPSKQLIELKTLIPTLQYDLYYASTKNFTGVRMYPKSTQHTYLRQEPAGALLHVANELLAKGIGIRIWDAYRPFSVTVRFWELIGDERYVANPSKGSGHNKGIAVDLTLVDLKTGAALDMPTAFDDFSVSAHHGFMALPPEKIANRELLRSTMIKHGFLPFATEWWHYYWPGADEEDVLDMPFKTLKALQPRLRN